MAHSTAQRPPAARPVRPHGVTTAQHGTAPAHSKPTRNRGRHCDQRGYNPPSGGHAQKVNTGRGAGATFLLQAVGTLLCFAFPQVALKKKENQSSLHRGDASNRDEPPPTGQDRYLRQAPSASTRTAASSAIAKGGPAPGGTAGRSQLTAKGRATGEEAGGTGTGTRGEALQAAKDGGAKSAAGAYCGPTGLANAAQCHTHAGRVASPSPSRGAVGGRVVGQAGPQSHQGPTSRRVEPHGMAVPLVPVRCLLLLLLLRAFWSVLNNRSRIVVATRAGGREL